MPNIHDWQLKRKYSFSYASNNETAEGMGEIKRKFNTRIYEKCEHSIEFNKFKILMPSTITYETLCLSVIAECMEEEKKPQLLSLSVQTRLKPPKCKSNFAYFVLTMNVRMLHMKYNWLNEHEHQQHSFALFSFFHSISLPLSPDPFRLYAIHPSYNNR